MYYSVVTVLATKTWHSKIFARYVHIIVTQPPQLDPPLTIIIEYNKPRTYDYFGI